MPRVRTPAAGGTLLCPHVAFPMCTCSGVPSSRRDQGPTLTTSLNCSSPKALPHCQNSTLSEFGVGDIIQTTAEWTQLRMVQVQIGRWSCISGVT